jgi:outer membrane protein insertion porin family
MNRIKYLLLFCLPINIFATIDTQYIDNVNFSTKDFYGWWEIYSILHNKIYSPELLNKSKDTLQRFIKNSGYIFNKVTYDTTREIQFKGKYINVLFNIISGPKFTLKKVNFIGNHVFSERKLKSHFKTKEKHFFGNGILNFDEYKSNLDSLLHYYYEKGYIDAKIVSDSIKYDTINNYVFIKITVNEGINYRIGNISFSGDTLWGYNILRPYYWIRTGERYNQNKFDVGRDSVVSLFHYNGYANVIVSHNLLKHNDTCDIGISIKSGNKIFVNKITIEGNTYTIEKVIRRDILLIPGQIFIPELINKSLDIIYNNLNKPGFYIEIKPRVIDNNDNTVNIIFEVVDETRL